MTTARAFKEFKAILSSCLAPDGFTAVSDSYWRHVDDTLVLVEVQKDRKRSSRSEVVFTINLGISIDLLRTTGPERRGSTEAPPSEECHWRIRLGRLLPTSGDIWWSVRDGETASLVGDEICQALAMHALPKVYAMASSEKLITEWRAGRGRGLTEYERRANLARLLCRLGRSEQAKVAIRDLENASTGKAWEFSAKHDVKILLELLRQSNESVAGGLPPVP